MRKLLSRALKYASLGYLLVHMYGVERDGSCACSRPRCDRIGKHPIYKGGVHSATRDKALLIERCRRHPRANIGIATGEASGLLVLDIDPRNGGDATLATLIKELGPLPETATTVTGGNGIHYFFRLPPNFAELSTKERYPGIDLLKNGSIAIVAPSRHASGRSYKYRKGRSLLASAPIAELPESWLQAFSGTNGHTTRAAPALPHDQIPEGSRNNSLARFAGYLVKAGLSDAAVLQHLHIANQQQCTPPLSSEEVERISQSICKTRSQAVLPIGDTPAYAVKALVLAQHYAGGDHLRFLPGHGPLAYTGTHWKPKAADLIQKEIFKVVESLPDSYRARSVPAAVSEVFRLISLSLTVPAEEFYGDEIKSVINCANGELWLSADGSVDFRSHSPTSRLLHCIAVKYDPAAQCRLYDKALLTIFGNTSNPRAMRRHMNELLGYLIQPVRNIALILMFRGGGSNGKSSLWNMIVDIVGKDNVVVTDLRQLERNRFMIGTLRGILIVVDDDIEAGEKLPDGPLKKLSEGKYVTGEKKGKDAFQFWNTAVPLLLCNNDPSTADISYGMRRRIMIIPFDRTFKKSEIDATLWPTIQEAEMSGVLNRLVGGYQRLRARKSRFKEPEAVRQAKEDWFINANPLMNFLKHKTRKVARSRIALALLYNAYVAWAGENGIKFVIQRNTLKRQLQQLNYNVANSNMGAVVVGLELLKGGRNA